MNKYSGIARPAIAHCVAHRGDAEVAGEGHYEEEQIESQMGEPGETNFENSPNGWQRRRGMTPTPYCAEHHRRENGQPNRLAHQHEEIAL
jgi:hypothetical protein